MGTLIGDDYQPLWKDRKRILGMPITFTKYEVTANRLITHRGLLRTETDELLLYRIMDIKMSRTLGQKLFGVGTITIYCADQSSGTPRAGEYQETGRRAPLPLQACGGGAHSQGHHRARDLRRGLLCRGVCGRGRRRNSRLTK